MGKLGSFPFIFSMNESLTATALLKRVVDTLPQGIFVYESVRNAGGQIADLRLILTNSQADKLLNQPTVLLIGQVYSQLFPDKISRDRLPKMSAVVATGQPFTYETHTPSSVHTEQCWYEVQVAKLDDGLVVTYTDITDRKQAQHVLQQRADTFFGVLQSMTNGLSVFSVIRDEEGNLADLQYEYISDFTLHETGIARERYIGERLLTLFPEARKSRFWLAYETALRTGQPQIFEEHYHYDGYDNYLHCQVTRLDGDRLVSIYHNVNELHQARARMQQQADLLRNVIENTQVGIGLMSVVRNPKGVIVDFCWEVTNEANARITNLSVDAMTGKRMTQLMPGTVEAGFFANCVRVAETGEPMNAEIPYFHDGVQGWFDLNIVKIGDGILFSSLDVTDRKQAELIRQQQAATLQMVVDNTPVGLLLVSPVWNDSDCSGIATNSESNARRIIDFRFLLTNRYNAERAGKTVDGMTGRLLGELFPDWQSSDLFNRFVEVIETGTDRKLTFPYNEFNWSGWYEGTFAKVGDELLYTYIDITSVKEGELNQQHQAQALEMANRELQRSNDNLQSFAYVASHDLQEPLRKIQAFGDLLASQYAPTLDQTGQDYLQRMQNAASRMSMLIKDLLAYSRLSIYQESFRPVNLSELISNVLSDLELVIRESGAIVQVDALPTLPGDRMQVRQLFQNLLTNALKFRRPDQQPIIHVSARPVWPAELPPNIGLSPQTHSAKSQAFVEISVSDNGIGFDTKYADRIFQVFQRLHVRSQYEGSGVGLAICKRVAENHHGAIQASSQPGEGSTFRVYLPVGMMNDELFFA